MNARKALSTTVIVATLVAVGSGFAAAHQPSATDPPPPATGHAQVIAQGVVSVDEGAYRWTLDSHQVESGGNEFVAESDVFLLAGSQPIGVDGAEGTRTRLADGEATFRPAGSSAATSTGTDQAATLTTIALVSAPDGGDDSFVPGAGSHDVDLLRDVLGGGETFTLTTPNPAFVLVTAGSVTDADGVPIGAGASANYSGDVSFSNAGTEPAALVVGVVGPALDAAAPPESTGPAPTQPNGTQATTPPTTPTTTTPPLDTDGDGLTDEDEVAIGSNKDNPDTDDDGLNDGDEVNVTHTSPTSADSDGDGYNDYLEAHDYLTDPNSSDTDGDGIGDNVEINGLTDPSDADSDNDGFNDGDEIDGGTNPLDVNDHP